MNAKQPFDILHPELHPYPKILLEVSHNDICFKDVFRLQLVD